MLICTILMLGQMEIAVPVLPLPPWGLGKAYVSLLRLPWISCQRVRCGTRWGKEFCPKKPVSGKFPLAWQRAMGTEAPVLSCPALGQPFGGLPGRWGLKPEHLTHPHSRTCYPPALAPGGACGWGTGGRSVTAELLIFAYKPWHRDPLSFAHLDAEGFLKPTKCPRVLFTSTGAILHWPDQVPVPWVV